MITHLSYLIFCRVQFLHTFPEIFWPNIPVKIFRIPRYPSLANTTPFLRQLYFLICHALARAPATEKDTYIPTYILNIKALILVLGLLQVVGTVKMQWKFSNRKVRKYLSYWYNSHLASITDQFANTLFCRNLSALTCFQE